MYIEPGLSVAEVGTKLYKENLISNKLLFKVLLKITRNEKKIHHGEYEFKGKFSILYILKY